MARQSTIRYFKSRGAYYTQYRGKQHCLATGPKDEPDGPNYRRAQEEFAKLVIMPETETTNDDVTVSTLVSRYKHHLERHGRARSKDMISHRLDSALEHFGNLRIRDLKPFHVQRWLDAMRESRGQHKGRDKRWGDTMTNTAAERLVGVFRWAVKQGMITRNPVAMSSLTVPDARRRSRDFVLPTGEHEALVSESNPKLARLLQFLHGTGCRPGEAYNASAKHYDPVRKAIVFRWDAQAPDYVHKTARKTKKDRVIYLTDELNEMVASLAKKHPTGVLFRNKLNKAWGNGSVHQALKRVRDRLKLEGKMIAYSYRHTFATRWLLAGLSIKILADLMGNSVQMIERHYGHLDAEPEIMRRRLIEFTSKR